MVVKKLKNIAKKVPVLPSVYIMLRSRYIIYQQNTRTTEQVFSAIYKRNAWGGKDSVSGTGSDVHQTRNIIKELPAVFRELGISTILDIPCGDFNWMKSVDLGGIDYTGADIVNKLIENNTVQYGRNGVRFRKINLITDDLPKVDLVFCRDCFVHLPNDDVFSALNNLCNSQSEYLLTTTFTRKAENLDIAAGQWRILNLELAPFMLPKPLKIMDEGCTESDGIYTDKSLGLWRIADIRECLSRRST